MIWVANKKTGYNMSKEGIQVYIGRPSHGTSGPWSSSPLGNPYQIGPDGDRASVIRKYRVYFYDHLEGSKDLEDLLQKAKKGDVVLVCFNAPLGCHGDVIKDYLESRIEEEKEE